jgi:UDP-GlcNAc:undecaprenyl-phosphate/decaprenyl-phosphate GlcNAc-1-phosphate transferase
LFILLTIAAALVISLGATPVIRDLAVKLGAVDSVSSSRKVHTQPKPRLGGIAIVAGVYGSLLLGLTQHEVRAALLADVTATIGLAIAGIGIAALGLVDDLRGVRARYKLAGQLAAALVLYAVGFRIEVISNPFGAPIVLGPLSVPVTLLWIAGVSNAINLIDGLDGLAGGIAAAGAVVTMAMGANASDPLVMVAAAALLGGVLGFLVYNVNPASIFMGDSGSLLLGLVLAALSVRPQALDAQGAQGVPLLAIVLALGVPIADTFAAMVRRAARGMPMFSADREHVHHRLLDVGLAHRQAVIALWFATALLSACGVYVASAGPGRGLVVCAAIALTAGALYWLGIIRLGTPALRRRRERNHLRLRAIRTAAQRLRNAVRISEIRREVVTLAPVVAAESIRLRFHADRAAVLWEPRCLAASRFPVEPSDPDGTAVEVVWRDGKLTPDRDTEIAIELLCQNVAGALKRLERRYGHRRGGRDDAVWVR